MVKNLNECRCQKCNKKLLNFSGNFSYIEIKCNRCKFINRLSSKRTLNNKINSNERLQSVNVENKNINTFGANRYD